MNLSVIEKETARIRLYYDRVSEWGFDNLKNRMRDGIHGEYHYKEFNLFGDCVGEGTEDLYLNSDFSYAWVWVWDGTKRNKGGYRSWDLKGHICYRKADMTWLKEMYKIKYNAVLVDLR